MVPIAPSIMTIRWFNKSLSFWRLSSELTMTQSNPHTFHQHSSSTVISAAREAGLRQQSFILTAKGENLPVEKHWFRERRHPARNHWKITTRDTGPFTCKIRIVSGKRRWEQLENGWWHRHTHRAYLRNNCAYRNLPIVNRSASSDERISNSTRASGLHSWLRFSCCSLWVLSRSEWGPEFLLTLPLLSSASAQPEFTQWVYHSDFPEGTFRL